MYIVIKQTSCYYLCVRHIVVYSSLDDIDRERVSFGLTTRHPGLSLGLLCARSRVRAEENGEKISRSLWHGRVALAWYSEDACPGRTTCVIAT
jgi:hypothetical protein